MVLSMSKDKLPFEFKRVNALFEDKTLEEQVKHLKELNNELQEDIKTLYEHLINAKELNIKLLQDNVKKEREGKENE